MRRLFAISTVVLIAVLFAYPYNQQEVNATGGAFPYTKHGGGTTDGAVPYDFGNGPGVDRTVNPDYSIYYNSLNPEAGKYKGGECTQCHEPHASFGGSEAPPNTGGDAGPDPYLALKEYGTSTNYANLCWYCHENFSNINNSGSPPGMGRWRFYQGKTTYMASSHYSPPAGSFYWPGTSGDPINIWPRKDRSGLPNGNRGSCLNCHTPHGIKASGSTTAYDTTSSDGSGGVPANMQTVASGNPSVNADYLIPRQLIAWEETLCERCHDASGPSTKNIQDEINKRVLAGGSGHPVDDTALAGRHVASESLPITIKHVECYDCHNPHAAKTGTNVLGDGDGGRITGMKYVDINGVAQDPAPIGTRQPFIYEVCFRCHGNTYDQVFASDNPFPKVVQNRNSANYSKWFSNKRKEFDPKSRHNANYPTGTDFGYNTSYHPVAAPGLNRTYNLCMQLQNAFGLACTDPVQELGNLTINCTDCHNNENTAPTLTNPVTVRGPVTESSLRSTDKGSAYNPSTSPVGPHGSARNKLLRGNYLTTNSTSGTLDTQGYSYSWYFNNRLDTNGRPKFELCFLCHEESRLVGVAGSPGSYTNFGASGWMGGWDNGRAWNSNLHLYHLNANAACHDCHHNVHSNVEAQNTIYGNGLGSHLPNDSEDGFTDGKIDTHLINFGPQASGHVATKPRWYFAQQASQWRMYKCNLICHGKTMSMCAYSHGSAEGQWWGSSANWCAENS